MSESTNTGQETAQAGALRVAVSRLRRRELAPEPQPDSQLMALLQDSGLLLHYAVEAGIEVDPEIAQRIVSAQRTGNAVWDSAEAGALITATTKLAAKLHPVTAETLRACREEAHLAIRSYRRIAYLLAAFILPAAIVTFVCAAISNTINVNLKTANELAVALHAQVETKTEAADSPPPPGTLTNLQQFAVAMRAIYSRTRQLVWFIPIWVEDGFSDPFKDEGHEHKQMELSPTLRNTVGELRGEVDRITEVYQRVRLHATNVQDVVSILLGAMSNCILPVLYALLGACAYVLRAFTVQTAARTFENSYATPARFIIAGIGGGVVGLFNNFTFGQGASLPPLGVAFLIGYAADIFFSFLEGSMPNLAKAKPH